jgi:hypothetical protein
MRHVKLMLTALFALCALTAAVATSVASAEEGFLPTTTYSGTGGAGSLETLAKEKISCKATSVLEGTMKNDSEGKIGSIHFTGCTALGLPANSLADEKEVILVNNATALVCLINPTTLEFGILVKLAETLHIEVPLASLLINISGSIIGKIAPNAKEVKKEKTITFEQTSGDVTPKECTNTKGEKVKGELKYEQNESGKPENSGLTSAVKLTFAAETELMDK